MIEELEIKEESLDNNSISNWIFSLLNLLFLIIIYKLKKEIIFPY